jgi:hypothetical protein
MIARNDRPARTSALLDADNIDLRVLAPSAFYARFALKDVEAALDAGVRALGQRNGAVLTFAFELWMNESDPKPSPTTKFYSPASRELHWGNAKNPNSTVLPGLGDSFREACFIGRWFGAGVHPTHHQSREAGSCWGRKATIELARRPDGPSA